MRFFTFLLLLLSFQTFAQKKILVQAIRFNNNYDEVSINPFNKPENETAFLQALEKGLQERFGPVSVTYLGYKKIIVADKAIARHPEQLINAYQDLYRAKRQTNLKDYDVLVDVTVDIQDNFKGRNDNLQIISRVKVTDNAKKKLFKNKGTLAVSIDPIPFTLGQLNDTGAKVYEGFPLNQEKLMQALTAGIQKAVLQDDTKEALTVSRNEFTEYAEFTGKGPAYRVTARNDHAQFASKTRIFNILTFARYRPVIVKRLADNRDMLLHLRERRITDIGYNVGVPEVFESSKEHKYFVSKSQLSPTQKQTYFLQSIARDNKALSIIDWSDNLKFKLKDESHQQIGEFKFKLQGRDSEPVVNYTRSLSRIYHPWAVLEGNLQGKSFQMSTNPYTLNAVEIKWDGKLVGLITHAAAPKKYVRRGKNKLPYFIYFHPDCTETEQQLLLQTYQAFHLAHVLQNGRDVKRNVLPTASR